jgi:acyl-CoA reductase-like NAD-dependent aldehyde dehydrogenase
MTDMTVANVIDGRSVPGSAADRIEVLDPSTGQVVASFTESTLADVDAAVDSAKKAFPLWSAKPPGQRSEALHALADLFAANLADYARIESIDAGKPITAASEEELPGILSALRHFAGAGRVLSSQAAGEFAAGTTSYVRREPVGVVAGITPWNFPLWQAVWKIAPALIAGNTIVIKPAENTPLATTRFIEMAQQVLPAGVVNVVNGRGNVTGEALVSHPDVNLVSFTGSTRAGESIGSIAGSRSARVVLELGGNSPVLIFDDVDLEAALPSLTNGILFNAGQECMSATRLLVADSVHDALVEKLAISLTKAVIGDTSDPATTLGPLISEVQRDRVAKLIGNRSASSTIVTGGSQVERPGFYFEPTLIDGVSDDDELVTEEIFGPVATVQTFTDEAEAIAKANSVPQGLASSVWTRDLARGLRCVNAIDAGIVWVNSHMVVGPEVPLGGFRSSGLGKEGGLAGLEEFTRSKLVTISLG